MKIIKLITFLFLIVLFNACNESGTDPEMDEENISEFPLFPLQVVEIESESSDYQDLTNMISYLKYEYEWPWEMMSVYSPKKEGNISTRTFIMGDFTAQLKRIDDNDLITWKYILNGTEDRSNQTYYDFTEREILVTDNNKNVNAKLFSINSTQIHTKIEFEKSGYDSWVGSYYNIDIMKYDFIQNDDGSGELKQLLMMNQQEELISKFKWNKDGSGERWNYSNGVETYYGTW